MNKKSGFLARFCIIKSIAYPNPNKIMESLASKFENFSISETKLLYIDAMNIMNVIFRATPLPNHWDFDFSFSQVKKLVNAAKASNIQIKLFFDCDNPSEEAIKKWVGRREKEVEEGYRTMPATSGFLLGNMFAKCGVETHYSYEADNDDTLASHAQHDKAAILSKDRDFFRYEKRNYQVFSEFHFKKDGGLLLIPSPHKESNIDTLPRPIITPPPKTTPTNPRAMTLKTEEIWRMGAPSPLVRDLYNPYLVLRPLRQALYGRLKVIKPIKEVLPFWDAKQGKVCWESVEVGPDAKLDSLLDDPFKALESVFNVSSLEKPKDVVVKKWANHIFAMCALTFDICTMANGPEKNLFDLMLEAKEKFAGKVFEEDKTEEIDPSKEIGYETNCNICKKKIQMTKGELSFYEKKGFNLPKKCKECREKRKK